MQTKHLSKNGVKNLMQENGNDIINKNSVKQDQKKFAYFDLFMYVCPLARKGILDGARVYNSEYQLDVCVGVKDKL